MSCLKYAIDGKCCQCKEQVTEKIPGYSELQEVETRSGTHYVCDDCLERMKEKYEAGELDIFEIKD